MNDPPGTPSTSDVNVVTPGSEPISAPTGYNGDYVAFTSTSPEGGGQDCLMQDVTTIAGDWYTWTFDLAIIGTSNNLFMNPEWDAFGTNDTNFYGLGNGEFSTGPPFAGLPVTSSVSQPFQPFSFDLKASETTTTLFFHGNDTGGAILLANVSLTQDSATPEPGSFWLLGIGFMMVVLAALHKKALLPIRNN